MNLNDLLSHIISRSNSNIEYKPNNIISIHAYNENTLLGTYFPVERCNVDNVISTLCDISNEEKIFFIVMNELQIHPLTDVNCGLIYNGNVVSSVNSTYYQCDVDHIEVNKIYASSEYATLSPKELARLKSCVAMKTKLMSTLLDVGCLDSSLIGWDDKRQ